MCTCPVDHVQASIDELEDYDSDQIGAKMKPYENLESLNGHKGRFDSQRKKSDTKHAFRRSTLRCEQERCHIEWRLNGFKWKDSEAWKLIVKYFGAGLSQHELLAIAEVLANATGLKTDREAQRRKEVLVKWFDENLCILKPLLPYIELYSGNERLDLGTRE